MIYLYEAMDATGQEIKGKIEADGQEDAMTKIRQLGLFVTKIKGNGGSANKWVKTTKNHFPVKLAGMVIGTVIGSILAAILYTSIVNKPVAAMPQQVSTTVVSKCDKFEFEGHRYIKFDLPFYPTVHDPECPKCSKEKQCLQKSPELSPSLK